MDTMPPPCAKKDASLAKISGANTFSTTRDGRSAASFIGGDELVSVMSASVLVVGYFRATSQCLGVLWLAPPLPPRTARSCCPAGERCRAGPWIPPLRVRLLHQGLASFPFCRRSAGSQSGRPHRPVAARLTYTKRDPEHPEHAHGRHLAPPLYAARTPAPKATKSHFGSIASVVS